MLDNRAGPQLFVRAWRQYQALSQADLAQKAGMSREAISRLETRDSPARPSTVRKLSTALGIQPHELYSPPPDFAIAADQIPALEPEKD
jgi:transcriptional regulator with XRE-family HTH domain